MKSNVEKRICIIDPLSPIGHRDVNRVMIEFLRDMGRLTVLSSNSLLDKKLEGVEYIQFDDNFFRITQNSFQNRKKLLCVLKSMLYVLKEREFDVILFSSYEIVTMYLALNVFRYIPKEILKKTYMINHSNVDEITQSKIKELLFKRLSNDIRFLCYDEYVGKYIEWEYDKKWMLLRHNLNTYKRNFDCNIIRSEIRSFFATQKQYSYVIIPGELAFREDIISQMIELDKTGFLRNKKIKIFIKDKNKKYVSEYILIFNEYMSDAEYSFIFDRCDFVTIIYDSSKYVYRSSGIFFDALTFMKPLIYGKSKFFDDKKRKFGNFGIEYNGNVEESLNYIATINSEEVAKSISVAKDYYSDDNLKKEIKQILEKV